MSACTAACRRPSPSQAHCGACHATLGSVRDFDRHRVAGGFVDPASLGLVERARLWASPERHADDARKTAALRQNRRSRVPHTGTDATDQLPACVAMPEPATDVYGMRPEGLLVPRPAPRQPTLDLDLGIAG